MPARRKYDPRKLDAAVGAAVTLGAPEAGRRHGIPADVVRSTARRRNILIYRNKQGRAAKTNYTTTLHILHARFPGIPLAQTEIAAACGVSKERIRQIEDQALRKLRNHPAIKTLLTHLEK